MMSEGQDNRTNPIAAAAVAGEQDRYRRAAALIVEDPDVQGGAATFRGTRLLVHHVADLLDQGVPEAELREDHPRLTPEMIEVARIYAKAHPRRGRPRKPAWRTRAPAAEHRVGRPPRQREP